MKCDYCDSKATVFFTQIIGGSSKKSCLCEKCACENGVTDPEGFVSDDEELSSISEQAASAVEVPQPPMAAIQTAPKDPSSHLCPDCGFAFDDLKKTGRLGCSQCYQFFREEIKLNLEGMHKDTCHVGRVPAGMMEAFQNRQKIEKLEQEKAEAIAAEDYEKAGALHEKIEKLSAGLPTDGASISTDS